MTTLLEAQVTAFLTTALGRAPTASEISQGMLAPWSLSNVHNSLEVGTSLFSIGPTDDIQAAINQMYAQGGGTLYLKPGTYLVGSSLSGFSSVSLAGASPTATLLNFEGASHNLSYSGTNLYTTGTITGISGGVNVTGSGTLWATNVTPGQSLFLNTRWYLIAAAVDDTHLTLAEGYGDDLTFPVSYRIASIIQDVHLSNIGIAGSALAGAAFTDARRVTLDSVLFPQNGVGCSFTNCSEVLITDAVIASSVSDGVQFTNVGLCDFRGLASTGNGGHGFMVNNMKSVVFLGVDGEANAGDGFNMTTATEMTLIANASGNGSNGVELVSGCVDVVMTGCGILSNVSDGIKVTASNTGTLLTGSAMKLNGGYGLNIADASNTNTLCCPNTFVSNTTAAIHDLGTGTLIRSNIGATDN